MNEVREIKFRAWDELTETIVPWQRLKFDKDEHDDEICFYERDTECSYVGGADYKIMQYTGLTDKNGTEIYEGDIVTHTGLGEREETDEIIFEEGGFGTKYWHMADLKDIEVIGNIYEHSHLLKEGAV